MLQRCSGMVELGLLLLSECRVGERLRYRGARGWWSQTILEMVELGLLCFQSPVWV